ncbi:putative 3-demethylubiquinone-9 3-methyltransferase (glyoxalase superfamily) [Halanaerobium saccharolyticum]|uniref:Putative 3-demethylubiquinone-9 3-methyltransferase (Glyoxalase superfamily) n=1 Tax=Halanaerobium saccharolyticum TaxID=43595 RepID=A0A4R6LDX6_9FIRM|nr:VOC family protein [Halanaerobium saccharolyticum]TDO73405.1 putative 3-demethylubiquinone-9 3-methyltransferase (glyoxalase superfamily) [Halanaerobium saccharolyticum]
MQKIVSHLWFDKEAVEAAEFYTSIFPDSELTHRSLIKNTPSGDNDIVGFNIMGFEFRAISAGPSFKMNPSISFFINFDPSNNKNARKNLNDLWEKLLDRGKVLMPLQKYSWSDRYGWVQDKYGVSWQLTLTNTEEDWPRVIPSLFFTNEKNGKAEEDINYYISLFKKSKLGSIMHYQKNRGANKKGDVMFSDFKLADIWLTAMDGGDIHEFTFNEAISLMINCESQEEIDYYWDKGNTNNTII